MTSLRLRETLGFAPSFSLSSSSSFPLAALAATSWSCCAHASRADATRSAISKRVTFGQKQMRFPLGLLLVLLMSFAVGCQQYAPLPFELRDHAAAIADRDPAASAVLTYATRLARSPATAPYDPADGLSLEEAQAVALFFN